MFIGREEELALLRRALAQDGRAVMIYGKRRVGKTTLIRKALAEAEGTAVYYVCTKGSLQENIDSLVRELVRTGVLPARIAFTDLTELFAYLNSLPTRLILAIDEYPYLKEMRDATEVDSIFQRLIDERLSNIRLILSGSHIGMMKDMLREGNALYGRFHTVLRLTELSYLEAAGFAPGRAPYEQAAFFSVFGGSPFIQEAIAPGEDLRESIIRTILNPVSAVYLYASQLLLSDYALKMNAERILAALGNGRKRYSELEARLDAGRTGNLSKQLKTLMELELIHRSEPINKLGDNKKYTFELNDNLLRFYYGFVYPNGSALQTLGAEAFYEQYVAPELTQFIARRFESLCRDYFSLLVRAGKLRDIRNIGTYYYDDPVRKRNGEFDIALQHADSVTLVEAKFLAKPLQMDEIHRELGQIRAIPGLNVREVGFVSVNGFADREPGCLYITGEDLYALHPPLRL